jgi:hypothetical protein
MEKCNSESVVLQDDLLRIGDLTGADEGRRLSWSLLHYSLDKA